MAQVSRRYNYSKKQRRIMTNQRCLGFVSRWRRNYWRNKERSERRKILMRIRKTRRWVVDLVTITLFVGTLILVEVYTSK